MYKEGISRSVESVRKESSSGRRAVELQNKVTKESKEGRKEKRVDVKDRGEGGVKNRGICYSPVLIRCYAECGHEPEVSRIRHLLLLKDSSNLLSDDPPTLLLEDSPTVLSKDPPSLLFEDPPALLF